MADGNDPTKRKQYVGCDEIHRVVSKRSFSYGDRNDLKPMVLKRYCGFDRTQCINHIESDQQQVRSHRFWSNQFEIFVSTSHVKI